MFPSSIFAMFAKRTPEEERERKADQFDRLIDINKDLIVKVYGSRDNFIANTEYIAIGDYILMFDELMGNPDEIVSLAYRMGIVLRYTDIDDISEIMYEILRDYVFNKRTDDSDDVIDMGRERFDYIAKQKGINPTDDNYINRFRVLNMV